MSKYGVEHPWPMADVNMPWRRLGGRKYEQRVSMWSVYEASTPEIQDALQEILDEVLSKREREVVRCLVDEGLSLQATAEVLGLRAKSHIWRVRQKAFGKLRIAIANHQAFRERYGKN